MPSVGLLRLSLFCDLGTQLSRHLTVMFDTYCAVTWFSAQKQRSLDVEENRQHQFAGRGMWTEFNKVWVKWGVCIM